MPQLKAVIFDISGVINRKMLNNGYWKKLENERGLPEGSIKKTLLSTEFSALSYKLFTGLSSAEELEEKDFINLFNKQVGINYLLLCDFNLWISSTRLRLNLFQSSETGLEKELPRSRWTRML